MIFILCFILLPLSSYSSSLFSVFHASTPSQLEQIIHKQEQKKFTKLLCEAQKKENKIPEACFSIEEERGEAEEICLRKNIKNLTSNLLLGILKKRKVSKKCRKHLLERFKIIKYRSKDLREL